MEAAALHMAFPHDRQTPIFAANVARDGQQQVRLRNRQNSKDSRAGCCHLNRKLAFIFKPPVRHLPCGEYPSGIGDDLVVLQGNRVATRAHLGCHGFQHAFQSIGVKGLACGEIFKNLTLIVVESSIMEMRDGDVRILKNWAIHMPRLRSNSWN